MLHSLSCHWISKRSSSIHQKYFNLFCHCSPFTFRNTLSIKDWYVHKKFSNKKIVFFSNCHLSRTRMNRFKISWALSVLPLSIDVSIVSIDSQISTHLWMNHSKWSHGSVIGNFLTCNLSNSIKSLLFFLSWIWSISLIFGWIMRVSTDGFKLTIKLACLYPVHRSTSSKRIKFGSCPFCSLSMSFTSHSRRYLWLCQRFWLYL